MGIGPARSHSVALPSQGSQHSSGLSWTNQMLSREFRPEAEEAQGLRGNGEFTSGCSLWSVTPATKLLVLPFLSLGC